MCLLVLVGACWGAPSKSTFIASPAPEYFKITLNPSNMPPVEGEVIFYVLNFSVILNFVYLVIFGHLIDFGHFPIEIPIKVKKITDSGRSGPTTKTKSVLKAVNKMGQLETM